MHRNSRRAKQTIARDGRFIAVAERYDVAVCERDAFAERVDEINALDRVILTRLNRRNAVERDKATVFNLIAAAVFGCCNCPFFQFRLNLVACASVRERFAQRNLAVRRVDDVGENRYDGRRRLAIFVGDRIFERAEIDRAGGRDALVANEVGRQNDSALRLARAILTGVEHGVSGLQQRVIVVRRVGEAGIVRRYEAVVVSGKIRRVAAIERYEGIDHLERSGAVDQLAARRVVRDRYASERELAFIRKERR